MKTSSAGAAISFIVSCRSTSWKSQRARAENYTEEGVEKAIKNYWTCADRLAKEKVDHIIFSGAPISAVLTRPRVTELLHQTKERTGIAADAPLEALIAALKHLRLSKLAIGSRWADPVNNAIIRYLEGAGIKVVGITKRNQWASDSFAMTLEQGLEMALDVGREAAKTWPEAEGISVPGGAAMALHVIPALEEEFGKPTFTNMSAEVWNDLVRPASSHQCKVGGGCSPTPAVRSAVRSPKRKLRDHSSVVAHRRTLVRDQP